jgi:hypothetical protein
MPFALGLSQRALGRIALAAGKTDDAGERLDQALATFARCSAAFEAARTHLDLAALRAGQGDKHAAQEHLARAVATFEAADAPTRLAQARELARSLGLEERSALT